VRITEVDLQAKEIKEGQELEIPERLPCAVAFLRNEERNVFFAMHGLPETAAGEDLPSPDATARCVPQVLLADPGTRMSSGTPTTPLFPHSPPIPQLPPPPATFLACQNSVGAQKRAPATNILLQVGNNVQWPFPPGF